MTAITETLRDQALVPVECDIPQGMTVAQYRADRDQQRRTGPVKPA